MSQPEWWLRGPVPGVAPALMPAAHALLQTVEDVAAALEGLTVDEIWMRPDDAVASCGFHAVHVAGATDRLFTYARGETLSAAQREDLAKERALEEKLPAQALVTALRTAIDRAIDQLRATDVSTLQDERKVGRAGLPATVVGLLFHGAEHAQRHAGQITTTSKLLVARRALHTQR
jgi:uncharacterized damage-inducible protein DinB